MSNQSTNKTWGGKRVKGETSESTNFGMYTVLDIKRMMAVKDLRVRRRNYINKTQKGIILVDTPRLDKIDFDCTIIIRKGCWELVINDETIAKNTKKLAKNLKAIGYIKTV